MKKSLFFISLLLIFFSGFQSASASNFSGLKVGSRSDEVKNLQEALKDDTSIYPEGLVTGYFGTVTQKAVKKVQARCGLPETGTVDENTVRCIFPTDYGVIVSSPNGGEIWNKSQIQTIKWEVIQSQTIYRNNAEQSMPPIWAKASIDLFRRQNVTCFKAPCDPVSVFVKHLATVSLFNGSYSWKMDSDIANGSDYVVRITVGENIMPMYLYEKGKEAISPAPNIWPLPKGNWDESDNTFTIEGNVTPPSSELKQLLEVLKEISLQMAKAIQLLTQIISNQ